MPNRFTVSIAAAALFAFSSGLAAQNSTKPAEAITTPDFSGVWSLGDPSIATGNSPFEASIVSRKDIAAGRIPSFGFSTEEPPMQPWAAEKYRASRRGRSPHEAGPDEDDPIMYPYCIPHGFPRIYTSPFAFEVVQTPQRLYMIFESGGQTRRIFLDGRKHLEGWASTPLGVSHGRWDGNTLVVETDHLQSLERFGRLDSFGHPYTDQLQVTERIRLASPDVLQVDFLFDDPGAYARPWPGKKFFERKDWEVTEARTCEDHQVEDYLKDMKAGMPAGRQ